MKAALGALALALAATLLTLLLAEAGARLAWEPPRTHRGLGNPDEDPGMLMLDPELGFRGVPGYARESGLKLNAQGLRGRELPQAVGGEALRVAFLGDSFLVGEALDEDALVTARTEEALRRRGVASQVYNLSAVDYGTAQELLLLRRFGPRLRPDVVVLALYTGNDLINNSLELAGLSDTSPGDSLRPYLVPEGTGLALRWSDPLSAGLRRHSRLFAALENRLLGWLAARGIDWFAPAPPRTLAERLARGEAPYEHYEIFRPHDPEHRWERAWRTTLALIRAVRDECDALGARLLVLVIPSVEQVERGAKSIALDAVTRAAGRPLDDLLDWNLPERRLAEFLREQGIAAWPLLGPLREAAAAGERLYGRDQHWTASAHALVAEGVAERLATSLAPAAAAWQPGPGPVRRLPPAEQASAWLDFRASDHAERLGEGWLAWRPAGETQAGGWLLGERGLVVLVPTGGELVVRGAVRRDLPLPIQFGVEGLGAPQQVFALEQPGRFELRVPWRRLLFSSEGYAPVVLVTSRPGLRVEEIGFAPRATRSADSAG